MVLVYNFFIQIYRIAIQLVAPWNKKAKAWIKERGNLFEQLEKKIARGDKIIWFHCASAGELEQGKPLIEQLKKEYPSHRILISFFSPSGFNIAKKYQQADIITYLPVDTKKNASRFVELVNPELVIFIKYEFWYHYLAEIAFHRIPLLLVAGIFRKDQLFFKWYGGFYRHMLCLFRQIFVQDEMSLNLLQSINITDCKIGGDTRFDRVKEIADDFNSLPAIDQFAQAEKIIVAGSTWPADEAIIANAIKKLTGYKLIIAPHEINKEHIHSIQKLFPDSFLYSMIGSQIEDKSISSTLWANIESRQAMDLQRQSLNVPVLIIDKFGMLSRLYRYGSVAYVGGGFKKSGIHNTLEAAVYGKPVIFGPNFQKFREAKELIARGAAFSINTAEQLSVTMEQLFKNPQQLIQAGLTAEKYVEENAGATKNIIQFIQEKRLLTN